MYKRIHAIVLLFVSGILIVFMVSACNSKNFTSNKIDSSSTDNCRVIKHAMGETCVPVNPQRIVALDGVTMEDTIALGKKPLGAPINYALPVIPTKGIVDLGTPEGINLEKVLALKPDLIIGITSDAPIYPQLSQIAPTVLVEFNHSGEWKDIFAFVGKVLGKSEQVKQVMAGYSKKLEDFQQKINSSGKSKIQVSVVRLYPDGITLYTKVGFIGTILEDAGLSRPPSQDLDLEATKRFSGSLGSTIQYTVSRETFDKADADAVFVIVGNWDSKIKDVLSSLKADPLWSTLKAVRQNKVYEVGDHWVGSGVIAANAVIDDLLKYLVKNP